MLLDKFKRILNIDPCTLGQIKMKPLVAKIVTKIYIIITLIYWFYDKAKS